MTWDHPSLFQWCTRNGRVVIERAFYRDGFEIRHRVNHRDYSWILDAANDVRLFKTLVEAKGFARRALLQEAKGFAHQILLQREAA